MRKNNKLVTVRYRTILFGFNASPFILNYIIKFHPKKYPDDACSKILNRGMYVNNLIQTGIPVVLKNCMICIKNPLRECNRVILI